ncbi:MAG: hypothetical protein KDB79_13100 [Acidobacteria bacterium]|nr:hypothetical protein [Acidobacteriota bacterium]
MNKNKNHNTIYFLTTLSVYLGLVFVGASPQALAQTTLAKNSHSQTFKINAQTENALSKLQYKTAFEHKHILPFSIFTASKKPGAAGVSASELVRFSLLHDQIISQNDQIFVISNLPRASI